jgi:3-hydroxy acid dehydrogenase/malonic semialdehyde reductase
MYLCFMFSDYYNNKKGANPQKVLLIFVKFFMENKIALVTGASSGIGKACATILAKNGYSLILLGRRAPLLEELKLHLTNIYGTESLVLEVDVRNRQQVQKVTNELDSKWQKINILINNAGLARGLSSFENGDIDHWDTMIDTNIKGLLYVSRFVVPLMIQSGGGHIVNVGSIAGKEIYANGNVYCATKHAVDALSRSMRLDLSKFPIKVSAVHPGAVETEFSIVRFEGDEEKAKKVYEGFDNLVAEDVAEAVWFMLNRPAHVNINELTIMPTAQPMAGVIHRNQTSLH